MIAAFLVVVLAAGAWVMTRSSGGGDGGTASERLAAENGRYFETTDPIERGCALGKKKLRRIWLGYYEDHSEEIITVPHVPNFTGSFEVPNHSGPWDYLQTVPLVLYGPERIRSRGLLDTGASVTDLYSTFGALTKTDLEERRGRVLNGALVEGVEGVPKLTIVVVWDGVGRNVMERWPDAYPNLKRLEEEGVSYLHATVGSSPTITPAIHSNIGTGAFPTDHGVVGIKYRDDNGVVREPFAKRRPRDLKLSTFMDQIGVAYDNLPNMGMLAWRSWHMGMLSHGAAYLGGKNHHLALIRDPSRIITNPNLYELADNIQNFPGFEEYADELDRQDGVADGKWMGHDVHEMHDNPAWVYYQRDILMTMLEQYGYGQRDGIPDMFTTNFKPTDIVGHQHSMDSEEMEVVLAAQDEVLGELVDWLDENVSDYVLALTSDHGHTPHWERTGAWPIGNGRVGRGVERHFETAPDMDILQASSAVGFFIKEDNMEAQDITPEDVAEYLNGYTIGDNWDEEELPEGYEDRADEPIYEAAFAARQLPEVMECAFGEQFQNDPTLAANFRE